MNVYRITKTDFCKLWTAQNPGLNRKNKKTNEVLEKSLYSDTIKKTHKVRAKIKALKSGCEVWINDLF
jgi:hypothetical protein